MIGKFMLLVCCVFAAAGLTLNALSNLLNNRSFALTLHNWSLAIAISTVGIVTTLAALGAFWIKETASRRRREK
jgi:hypothetical protein